jgi:hypothetical protein
LTFSTRAAPLIEPVRATSSKKRKSSQFIICA